MNQLKAGVALSYVVIGLNSLVGLLYTPYMLRIMGQSEYGLYSLVASVIAYLTILDLGFGNAIIRYTAKYRAEGKVDEQYSMFGMLMVIYSIIGVVVFFLGMGLYLNVEAMFGAKMTVDEIAKARIMILIMVFNLAVTFPFSIFGAIIKAYENFVFQNVIQIIRIILNTLTMIILLKLGFRAIGMVVLVTIFNGLTLFINYWYCKYKIKIKINFNKFQWGFLKEVSLYSFYIFLNVIMDRIYWSTGQFLLGVFVGTTAIAVFAVALHIEQIYMNFSSAITSVFLPKVTAMTTIEKTGGGISDLFIRTGRIQYIVMSFVLSVFILFGRQFIILWAGSNYADSYTIALIILLPLTIPLVQNLGVTVLQARNQMKFRSILYIVIALCSLALQIPLAQKYEGVGVAVGIAIALVVGQIIAMNIYYYKKQGIDIPKFWEEIAKMSIFPTLLGATTYLLLSFVTINTVSKLVLGVASFSILYFPAFWVFSMNQYERELLSKPLIKIISKLNF